MLRYFCPNCSGEIAITTFLCPHCGYSFWKDENGNEPVKIVTISDVKLDNGLPFKAQFIGDRIAYPLVRNMVYPITIKKNCDFFPISVKVELPEGKYATKYFELFYTDDDSLFSEWKTIIE